MSPVVPSMSDRDAKIWMDAQRADWRDAKIHVRTHTLHYGCGAFEGVRAYETDRGTAVFRLQDHTKRSVQPGAGPSNPGRRAQGPWPQVPIREVDRVQIGEGRRGRITETIQTACVDIVNGRNPKYAHWLTSV